MCIQQVGELILPPRHNTVGVSNQISFLVLYYNSSQLAPLLEVKSLILLILQLVSSSSILAFRYAFFLFLRILHRRIFSRSSTCMRPIH